MRPPKTLFVFATILLVSAILGLYGHAAIDDHGAEEVCQICIFLQSGVPGGVVFSLTLFLVSHILRGVAFSLLSFAFPIATSGRSPPIF